MEDIGMDVEQMEDTGKYIINIYWWCCRPTVD